MGGLVLTAWAVIRGFASEAEELASEAEGATARAYANAARRLAELARELEREGERERAKKARRRATLRFAACQHTAGVPVDGEPAIWTCRECDGRGDASGGELRWYPPLEAWTGRRE